MTSTDGDRQVIQRVTDAMQAGASGEDEMVGLFAEAGIWLSP